MNVNISLIRDSFNAVKPHADEFTEHFYHELFTRYPAAKALFARTNMPKQRKALAASLSHIVDYWDDREHLEDYLFKMGARHVKYSTEEAHFPLVAEALLATFEFFFEKQWTEELKGNWTGVYVFVQTHMLRGIEAARKKDRERLQEVAVPTIEELARQMARDTFKKALDEEAAAALQDLAREKAKDILRKALENEAKDVMRSVARKAA